MQSICPPRHAAGFDFSDAARVGCGVNFAPILGCWVLPARETLIVVHFRTNL